LYALFGAGSYLISVLDQAELVHHMNQVAKNLAILRTTQHLASTDVSQHHEPFLSIRNVAMSQ
jgi:hypothetical protein